MARNLLFEHYPITARDFMDVPGHIKNTDFDGIEWPTEFSSLYHKLGPNTFLDGTLIVPKSRQKIIGGIKMFSFFGLSSDWMPVLILDINQDLAKNTVPRLRDIMRLWPISTDKMKKDELVAYLSEHIVFE